VEVAVWVVDAKALDTAGVRDGGLREDYTEQRKLVARFRRSAYLAVRLLLPTPLVPHVIAATAFMHHSDNVLDEGRPRAERAAAYAVWEKQVRDGLATGGSDHPVIRLERHSVTRADLEDARDLPGTGNSCRTCSIGPGASSMPAVPWSSSPRPPTVRSSGP
jgi:phytoene synthase